MPSERALTRRIEARNHAESSYADSACGRVGAGGRSGNLGGPAFRSGGDGGRPGVRGSDDTEFVQFVDGHARELRRTAYLMCGDWQRAEDATQDALVKLYVAWPRLERSSGLRAYAHRAVTTAVVDQSRRPWRREVGGKRPPRRGPRPDRSRSTGTSPWCERCRTCRTAAANAWSCATSRTSRWRRPRSSSAIAAGTVKSQTARALEQVRDALHAPGARHRTGGDSCERAHERPARPGLGRRRRPAGVQTARRRCARPGPAGAAGTERVAVGLTAAAVAGMLVATQLGGQVAGPSRRAPGPDQHRPVVAVGIVDQPSHAGSRRSPTSAPASARRRPGTGPRGQDGQDGLRLPAEGRRRSRTPAPQARPRRS